MLKLKCEENWMGLTCFGLAYFILFVESSLDPDLLLVPRSKWSSYFFYFVWGLILFYLFDRPIWALFSGLLGVLDL